MDLVESTVGFLLCGVLFSVFLFGIVTVQTYIYFRTFPNDPPILRRLISLVWVLEFGTALCITMGVYTIFVTNFGKLEGLERTPNSLNCSVIFGGMVDNLVKSIFVYRLYKFSSKLFISIALWAWSLLLFAIVIVIAIRTMRPIPLDPHSRGYEWQLSVMFVGSAVQDMCIAGSMCYYLRKQRKGALKTTTLLLDRLFIYTIETGVVTSVVAVLAAVSYFAMKTNYVWMMFYVNMHTFFSNALLSSLNNRAGMIPPTDHVNLSAEMASTTARDSIISAPGHMKNPGYISPTFGGHGLQNK